MAWRDRSAWQEELRRAATVPPAADKDAFWRDFHRRAPVRVVATASDEMMMVGAVGWRWAWAAVAVLAVTITAALWLNRSSGGDELAAGATPQWAANEEGVDVTLVNVNVPCRGVVVVRDAAERGTVVWVAGIDRN